MTRLRDLPQHQICQLNPHSITVGANLVHLPHAPLPFSDPEAALLDVGEAPAEESPVDHGS